MTPLVLAAVVLVQADTGNDYTRTDKALLVSSSVLIAADWMQTVEIARRGYVEYNPVLGPHPNVGPVNLLFGATLGANIAVSQLSNRPLRRFLWIVVIVAEGGVVVQNNRQGIQFSVRF